MSTTPNSKGFQKGQYSKFKIGRRNRRLVEDIEGTEEGLIVSHLLYQDTKSCQGVLNAGQDDEMSIIGYRRSIFRTILCWLCIVLTGGLMRLIMHWSQYWYLLATHCQCSLDVADKVLIIEDYQGKHTVHYVKDVIVLNAEKLKKMRNAEEDKWKNYFPLSGIFNESLFQFSIHFSGGNFKSTKTIRFFCCKQLRYVWDVQSQSFLQLKGLDTDIPSCYLHRRIGLSQLEESSRRLVYGLNQITVPVKGTWILLFLEVLNPFYVFQVFSVILWMAYSYYYYAVVIIIMSVSGIVMTTMQTKKNQQALRSTVQNSDCAIVVHDDETTEQIETKYLVPGDLIEIPCSGCTMQCDAVLLSGNCILDESMLTGESVPITKTPLPLKIDLILNVKEHSRHMLFCGTKIIQTRYIGLEKVVAIVINTGNITAKGGLIRSILYPPPVDYKFEQDSYKFIALLGLIAGMGFIYTLVTKIIRNVAASKIAIESLDLITIAVPPALPAAMTVGRFYAQRRLQKQNIYCISPRSINVSGSIDCVCFDKTGTLTEDGLDMWGVVPKSSTNRFQIPLKQIDRLPLDHFLFGMVTCHSITIINGEKKGDPLDLKMFESTGWFLEEANIADDNKYDLLFPTIVRQPTPNRKSNGAANNVDEMMESANDIGIVREFSFTSSLQRMSVITRRLSDNHFNVYCKGSPEMIQTLCRPETIPESYLPELNGYAQLGYRIIAIAYKPLDKKLTYAKLQRIGRDRVESDLEFQGFVVMENRLKPDTTDVIKGLLKANIRIVMATGDNILTALSVAKDCGIITSKQNVITVNTRLVEPTKYEVYYNLTGIDSSGNVQSNSIQTPSGTGEILSLITTSNSVASLETMDTWTYRDAEIGVVNDHIKEKGYDQLKFSLDQACNNYCFAMIGKTWSVIREHFPELIPRLATRGTVFARMSPEQKQTLILELQDLGYYVAMCGDGANDCGALKAAHAGISLSDAESSLASPFTSKNPTIACVPSVIREGRSALVTSFGIFKYMAAYSLIQFTSVLILYSINANLTDLQFLYIDLFLISLFAFFFGKTESYDGPLNKKTPLSSLISASPIASLVLQLIVSIAFQGVGWFHVQSEPWFVPYNSTGRDDDEFEGSHENYAIFIISCFQYIILAIIFSKGAPYRKSIVSNKWFLITIIVNILIVIYLAMIPAQAIAHFLGLVLPDDYWFRGYLLIYGLANFLISLFIEVFIIEYLLFKKLRSNCLNLEKSRTKYVAVENELRNDYQWPPLTYYQNDVTSMNNDKSSPISYSDIIAEHGVDIQTPYNESCVLNNFFDNNLDSDFERESMSSSASINDYNDAIDMPMNAVNVVAEPEDANAGSSSNNANAATNAAVTISTIDTANATTTTTTTTAAAAVTTDAAATTVAADDTITSVATSATGDSVVVIVEDTSTVNVDPILQQQIHGINSKSLLNELGNEKNIINNKDSVNDAIDSAVIVDTKKLISSNIPTMNNAINNNPNINICNINTYNNNNNNNNNSNNNNNNNNNTNDNKFKNQSDTNRVCVKIENGANAEFETILHPITKENLHYMHHQQQDQQRKIPNNFDNSPSYYMNSAQYLNHYKSLPPLSYSNNSHNPNKYQNYSVEKEPPSKFDILSKTSSSGSIPEQNHLQELTSPKYSLIKNDPHHYNPKQNVIRVEVNKMIPQTNMIGISETNLVNNISTPTTRANASVAGAQNEGIPYNKKSIFDEAQPVLTSSSLLSKSPSSSSSLPLPQSTDFLGGTELSATAMSSAKLSPTIKPTVLPVEYEQNEKSSANGIFEKDSSSCLTEMEQDRGVNVREKSASEIKSAEANRISSVIDSVVSFGGERHSLNFRQSDVPNFHKIIINVENSDSNNSTSVELCDLS